ncbi:MAG: hypothetical protein FJZ95_01720 [Chloroflexi bacterium]|nr:hypothetical protein [Chloroflexota bacterium]
MPRKRIKSKRRDTFDASRLAEVDTIELLLRINPNHYISGLTDEEKAIQAELDRREGYEPGERIHQVWPCWEGRLEEWERSPEGIFQLAARERRKQEYADYRRAKGYPH